MEATTELFPTMEFSLIPCGQLSHLQVHQTAVKAFSFTILRKWFITELKISSSRTTAWGKSQRTGIMQWLCRQRFIRAVAEPQALRTMISKKIWKRATRKHLRPRSKSPQHQTIMTTRIFIWFAKKPKAQLKSSMVEVARGPIAARIADPKAQARQEVEMLSCKTRMLVVYSKLCELQTNCFLFQTHLDKNSRYEVPRKNADKTPVSQKNQISMHVDATYESVGPESAYVQKNNDTAVNLSKKISSPIEAPPLPPPLPPPLMKIHKNFAMNPSRDSNDSLDGSDFNRDDSDMLSLESDSGLEVVEEPTLRPSELVRGNNNRSMSIISGACLNL